MRATTVPPESVEAVQVWVKKGGLPGITETYVVKIRAQGWTARYQAQVRIFLGGSYKLLSLSSDRLISR